MAFIYDLSDTWNNAGISFNGIKLNATDTASAAGSKLLDLQISGVSKFNVGKTGTVTATGIIESTVGGFRFPDGTTQITRGVGSVTSVDGSITVSGTTTVDLSVATAGYTSNVLMPIRNTTGATLTKGTAVYISGATGQISTVTKAIANSDPTSAQTLGLVAADIANNANGNVTLIGTITNLNTSAYTDGQQLYLSPTTAGTLTATKPYAPNHLVYMAVVEHAHPTQGKLFVKVQNGYEMDELHDVSAQSPSNGQTIVYNSVSGLWEKNTVSLTAGVNGTLPVANGGTGVSTLTSGYLVKGNGTSAASASVIYDNGTNVGIGTASASYKLDVNSAATPAVRTTGPDGVYTDLTNGTGTLRLQVSSSSCFIGSASNGPLAFNTNSAERMRIEAAGNVGIGTSAPGTKLEVSATSAGATVEVLRLSNVGSGANAQAQIKFYAASTFYGSISGGYGAAAPQMTFNLPVSGNYVWQTSGTERMRLDSAGNVGIGVTPSAWGANRSALDMGTNAYVGGITRTNLMANVYFDGTDFRYKSTGAAGVFQIFGNSFLWQAAASGTAGNTLGLSGTMTLDATGSLGLGITPSAWNRAAIEVGVAGCALTRDTRDLILTSNAYVDAGGWKYAATTGASRYDNAVGTHRWFTAPSGTAGAAIGFTQAMTLDVTGSLTVGTTISTYGYANNPSIELNGTDGATIGLKKGNAAGSYISHSNNLNIFNTTANAIVLATSSTERMRITSGGNVGIGTAAPVNEFEIYSSGSPRLAIRAPESITESIEIGFQYGTAANASTNTLAIIRAVPTQVDPNPLKADLSFSTNAGDSATERMRLDSAGNLLLGTTVNNGIFCIGAFSATGATQGYSVVDNGRTHRTSVDSASAASHYVFYNTNGAVGSISTSAMATVYNIASDARLKHDIVDAPEASSLIDAMQVRSFKWNADNSNQRYGFIAQELIEVAPEAVGQLEDPNSTMGVDYSKLVPMLVKEIQSLRARVAQLEGN
jgi:hypothetical protein